MTSSFGLIDLFAGAGGMTLGFRAAGFEPLFAVESDPASAKTYANNFGCHVFNGLIQDVDDGDYPDADVVAGGPPCQGFSPLGRDQDLRSREALNGLWKEFLEVVELVAPSAFVLENVPQFLSSDQFVAFRRRCKSGLILPEYNVRATVLSAADYGVPQQRRRAFVIGLRGRDPSWPPKPTHGPNSSRSRPYRTVRDAIGKLPAVPTGKNLHIGRNPTERSLKRYAAIPSGGNRFDLAANAPGLLPPCWRKKKTGTTDVFGRLWWDRPATTIRTEFFKPEKGRFLHPDQDRPLTHREAARLQSFPDWFVFEGNNIEVARQIGNAVPPRLAEVVGRHLMKLLIE